MLKKVMLVTAILLSINTSAQAMNKEEACQAIKKLGASVVEAKNAGVPYEIAIAETKKIIRDYRLSKSHGNYMMGVVAIGYETTLASRTYARAVYDNCKRKL